MWKHKSCVTWDGAGYNDLTSAPPLCFHWWVLLLLHSTEKKNTQSQNINIIKPKHYDTLSQKGWYIFKNVMEIKPWFIYLVRRVYRELICMLSHIFPTKRAPGFWKWNTSYDCSRLHLSHWGGVAYMMHFNWSNILIWKFTDRTFHLKYVQNMNNFV